MYPNLAPKSLCSPDWPQTWDLPTVTSQVEDYQCLPLCGDAANILQCFCILLFFFPLRFCFNRCTVSFCKVVVSFSLSHLIIRNGAGFTQLADLVLAKHPCVYDPYSELLHSDLIRSFNIHSNPENELRWLYGVLLYHVPIYCQSNMCSMAPCQQMSYLTYIYNSGNGACSVAKNMHGRMLNANGHSKPSFQFAGKFYSVTGVDMES